MSDGPDKARYLADGLRGVRYALAEVRQMLKDDGDEVMIAKVARALRDNGGRIVGKANMKRAAYLAGPYCQLHHFDDALLRAEFRGIVSVTRSTELPGRPFVFSEGNGEHL